MNTLRLRSRPKTTSHFCVRWALPTLLMVSQNDGVIFGQALRGSKSDREGKKTRPIERSQQGAEST